MMLRTVRLIFSLLLAATVLCVRAQDSEGLYYPYEYGGAYRPSPESDTLLFYRAVQSAGDLFDELTAFRFGAVKMLRRGQPHASERVTLGGVDLSYRYLAPLRYLGAGERVRAGVRFSDEGVGAAGGVRSLSLRVPQRHGASVAVHATDRDHRAGVRAAASFAAGRWSVSLSGEGRLGDDAVVEGLFTHGFRLGARLQRDDGDDGGWVVAAVLPVTERGLRSSSTEEAFALRGDPYYNPSWGEQAGRVRNSRVRRECLPMAALFWQRRLKPGMDLTAAASVEAGVRRTSSLAWFDAPTPQPDHYRYLPSYLDTDEVLAVAGAWRAGERRYTQVDWAELWRRNRASGGEARYAVADRTERPLRVQGAVRLRYEPDGSFAAGGGVRFARASTRRYRELRDLLGAEFVTDIDQYLLDDDTYSNALQNDLRHPGRRVGEGGRFGYDYSLLCGEVAADAWVRYRSVRWNVAFAAEAGMRRVRRNGHYEKELFPGAGSYGPSATVRLAPYAFKAAVGYAFTPRSYLEAAGTAAGVAPYDDMLFMQPDYNNRTVDRPALQRVYGAEANFVRTGERLDWRVSLFATYSCGELFTTRLYDDLSAEYADLSVRGIGRLSRGVEGALRLRLGWHWSVSAAVTAGRYTYRGNPRLTLLADTDNRPLVEESESYMEGYRTGAAPGVAATVEASYFGPTGWSVRLSVDHAGSRYAEPSYLYRTLRVAGQAAESAEAFEAFTRQRELGSSFTVDLSAGKSWRLRRSRLSATLMLRNLLDDRETVWSAYESNRMRRIRSGGQTLWRPMPQRLLYALPRSWYATVSYKW